MTNFGIFMIFMLIFMGVIMGMTPYMSRSNIHFGVTLPHDYRNQALIVKKKKQYLIWNIVVAFILAIPIRLIMGIKDEQAVAEWSVIYTFIAIFGFLFFSIVLFLQFRKSMLHLKAEIPVEKRGIEKQEIVIDTTYREKRQIVPSWVILISHLFIIGLIVGVTFFNYDQIPATFSTHYNFNMQPNRFVEKNIWTVLTMPLIQFGMMLLFLLINLTFKQVKQSINPRRKVASTAQSHAYRYAWSLYLVMLSIVLQLFFGFIQFSLIFSWIGNINLIFMTFLLLMVIFVPVIYLAIKYGQAGERLHLTSSEDTEDVEVYDDDKFWKWGLFYYNKQDPTIWVEKRFGIGTALNFGNPKVKCVSFITLVGLIIFMAVGAAIGIM